MAEALLGSVCENLLSLLQNEFATISGIKEKAEKLSTTLDLIKAVLEDAEQKQVTERSNSIKVWLQQLKDATYVLDDILEEFLMESHRFKGIYSFTPKNIKFRLDIGNRLNEITKRFDEIAKSKNKFLLREGVTLRERPTEVAEWRQTCSIIAEPKVYGREDDKEKIVEFLLTQARGFDFLSIYPIVGLGGVGKTTLFQLVYNDDRVSRNFDTKVWVCVSEVFSVKRILCSIIESITREKCHALDLDVIVRNVQELLQGKRYLLVLDDVWKGNQELESGLSQDKWCKLKSVLSCGSKGAAILVSTRDKDVAKIMGTCQARHLSVLSENDCWLLLKQYAFEHDKEERKELVEIGKEIVKKCGGLPLAAKALGGIMHSRCEEKEWLEIKESPLWTLQDEDKNSILLALRLSYFHLTPTLKQCFSFCAIFPKDTEIMKEDLIHLWMANGFISSRAHLKVEDVGNSIWNELCQKSFFQDIKIDDYTGDVSFKMHDLVHDLAQSITGPECLFLENTNTNLSRSTHHIGFGCTELSSFRKGAFKNVESLRTWYPFEFYESLNFSDFIPTHCSLRVLRTSTLNLSLLESLIHLRYLELHDLDIETLPNSICSLRKLEILKLRDIDNLSCLPKHLTCLKNLRHLVIDNCPSLSCLFPNVGKLSFLQTLSVYIVKLEEGYSLGELHDLNLLGGKLRIEGLKNVGSLSEAREPNLMDKKDLRELCLSWKNSGETETPATSPEQVLEVLQAHSNLKRLEIIGYDGLCLPSWIGILSDLVEITLSDCNKCKWLSPLGKLPSLKVLNLNSMDEVLYLDEDESRDGVEVSAFPSLEKLSLFFLPKLERLLKVQSRDMFPRLSQLSITGCLKLMLPSLPSIKSLNATGCSNELLTSISSLYSLTTLKLYCAVLEVTCLPEEMFRDLTCLQTLLISEFSNLKEFPNQCAKLALEHLRILYCRDLQYLPEQIWEGLRSLRNIVIGKCGLRCLPEGIRHLTSLELLRIFGCPVSKERCKEGTGEDWDKIAHIPKLMIEE